MCAEKRKRKVSSGWRKISTPEDLEKCIVTMINKILMSEDPLSHAGRFANLANSWTNTHRLKIDSEELKQLRDRLDAIEEAAKCD